MKILFAADGSSYTKKALAFLVTHEGLCGPDDELVVLNVQLPIPPRVKRMVGAATVNDYHAEEAAKVLKPIERFLEKHKAYLTSRTGASDSVSTRWATLPMTARPSKPWPCVPITIR